MFHRRLLLLLGLVTLGFIPLLAQLARLTLLKGEDLRRQAESRLVRSQQTPTVRGSILDRKGRVLAQDRPSYDVAVAYSAIDGSWANDQARRAAARAAGSGWGGLSREQQAEATAAMLPAFRVHLDKAWDRIAAVSGVARADVDAGRDRVIAMVTSRQQAVSAAREKEELARVAASGRRQSPQEERAMRRRIEAPIAEKRRAHAVVPRVGDQAGFASFGLIGEQVEIELPSFDVPGASPGVGGTALVDVAPGLEVWDSGERDYPFEFMRVQVDRSGFFGPMANPEPLTLELSGVACHILGTLRDTVYQSAKGDPAAGTVDVVGDAERRARAMENDPAWRALAYEGLGVDRGSYRDGDRIGSTGLENSLENGLRGLRGVQTSRLDTGERVVVPPVRGRDVRLTLDVSLQARVQALMDPRAGLAQVQPWHKQQSPTQKEGDPLFGGAVVLDIDTGDILSMVSTPTFTRRDFKDDRARLASDLLTTPLVNRAVGKYYTPGSIVKPLILVEAVRMGRHPLSLPIECTGHLLESQPTSYRCWIYKQFQTTHNATMGHDLSADDAIMVSCNIYFYTLGRKLGPEGIIPAYEAFGVGRTFGLGVGGEAPGAIGFRRDAKNRGLGLPDAIQMGIGQGPITWTPLHAANAYATLARGGVWISPRLVADASREEPRDLGLDSASVSAAIEGLRRSVGEDQGTGHHITIDGSKIPIFGVKDVKIWGKTGTAQAPKVVGEDPDGPNGPLRGEVLEEGDHSWFVVMVGRDRPRFVISVVIDFGGSGGKVSGPIVDQIIRALIEEGYL